MYGASFRALPRRGVIALCATTLLLAACGKHDTPGNGGGNESGNGSGNGNGNDNPLAQGNAQKVHLKWKQDHWEVALNQGSDQQPKDAKTSLPVNTGPTMFVVDVTGKSVTFADDPLSVWTGDKSVSKTGIEGTQILGPIIANGNKLVFFDLNQGDPITLNYAIHFKNGVPSVDPIIDNGGTNSQ